MSFRIYFALLVPLACAVATAPATPCAGAETAEGNEPTTVMARRGKLLVSDDFSRSDVGDTWKVSQKSYSIADGVFITGQRPEAKHPAVSRLHVPFKDAVVDFSFRFTGGKQLTLVFNDTEFKGSHAGHICRAGVSPQQISLSDDCEGAMKFGLYERWKDPDKRSEVEAQVKDRMKKVPVTFDAGKWHRMTVEIVGDEMVASLDGKPVAYLKSPGIAHATKTDWGFTTQGRTIEVDNLRAWVAEADTAWPQRRAELFPNEQ
jgi:hypothetical protein